jgi:PKD repeat protein
VKDSLSAFIRELPPESRVYLAAFNSILGTPTEAVIRSDNDRRILLDVVGRLDGLTHKPEAGATHLWWALDRALAKGVEYSKERPDRTVLVRVLTDGEDNDPKFRGQSAQAVLDEYATKYPGVDGSAVQANLVLLGSLDIPVRGNPDGRGVAITRALDFVPVFPPVIGWDPVSVKVGKLVSFFEASSRPYESYDWWIDKWEVSRQKTFAFTFPKGGDHSVRLLVRGSNGQREFAMATVQAADSPPMTPSFVSLPSSPEPQQPVKFFGRASGEGVKLSWLLGGTSFAEGPEAQRLFESEGDYVVTLVATDPSGRKEQTERTLKVLEPVPTVAFSAPSEVLSGAEVQLANTTLGTVASWNWDFGDGTSSTEASPKHRFSNASGEATHVEVVLHAKTRLGRAYDSAKAPILVHPVPRPPKAAFRVQTHSPRVGVSVAFIDESSGLISKMRWDFAGPGESDLKNPEYTFAKPGPATVRLTVEGPGGQDTAAQEITIAPREQNVRVSLLATNGMAGDSALPDTLDFGQVNIVHVHSQTLESDVPDTLEVLFPPAADPGTAVEVDIDGSATNAFRVELRRGGTNLPLVLPAKLIENAILRVAFNTNAQEGDFDGHLVLKPVGATTILNGKAELAKVGLRVQLGTGADPRVWMVAGLVVGALLLWVLYRIWAGTRAIPDDAVVELALEERESPGQKRKLSASNSPVYKKERFALLVNEFVALGRTPDAPNLFDMSAPDWVIRRESKRIALINRRNARESRAVRCGDVKPLPGEDGKTRFLAIRWSERKQPRAIPRRPATTHC